MALFGLSLFTFVAGLFGVDASAVKEQLAGRVPVRLAAGYLGAMGALVALLWLSEAVPASLSGTKPPSVAAVGLPANVVHVLDLGLVIPAVFLTTWWLLRDRAWGYVLAGVLFVKLVSIGVAVLGMIAWMAASGQPAAPAELGIFGLVTLLGLAVGAAFLRAVPPARARPPARTPASSGD
ncbi:MAG: hypothetical protein U5J98_09240 [Halobacteriales archaeon]|nr:hypothetical protein [Halobacteriales archaeon]